MTTNLNTPHCLCSMTHAAGAHRPMAVHRRWRLAGPIRNYLAMIAMLTIAPLPTLADCPPGGSGSTISGTVVSSVGTLSNPYQITGSPGCTITGPAGELINTESIENRSTFEIQSSGRFENNRFFDSDSGAQLISHGSIVNRGAITINGDWNNTGNFDNHIFLNIDGEPLDDADTTVTNAGVINNHGELQLSNRAHFTNTGRVENRAGGRVHRFQGGTTLENASGGVFVNHTDSRFEWIDRDRNSPIINSGGWLNDSGASMSLSSNTSFENSGVLQNGGGLSLWTGARIDNIAGRGELTNLAGGTLSLNGGTTLNNHRHLLNFGVLNNGGDLNNNHDLLNQAGATLNNNRNLISSKLLFNYALLNNGVSATLANQAELHNFSGATVSNLGALTNSGDVQNDAGAVITNSGVMTLSVGSSFTNDGTLENQNGGVIDNHATMTNNASLSQLAGSTMTNFGTINNTQNATFDTAGRLENNNRINLLDGARLTNSGTFENKINGLLSSSESNFVNNGDVVNGGQLIFDQSTVSNTGSLLNNVVMLMTDGTLSNTGSLHNVAGGFMRAGALTQTAGTLRNDGDMRANSVVISGGELTGTGTLQAPTVHVQAGADLNPGNSPGTLKVTGDLQLDGNLNVELDGTSRGMFDLLSVSGEMSFGSDSTITFDLGYTPRVRDIVMFLLADSISGLEDVNFAIAGAPAGIRFFVFENGSSDLSIQFTAVPIPASLPILAAALGGLAAWRRRR